MFSIEQIRAAHANMKSGADFPDYVQELIQLGVTSYDYYVSDGHAVYFGKNEFSLTSEAQYSLLSIAVDSDKHKLEQALRIHQQGQTDYLTFCSQAAEAGVGKWTVDMEKMTCEYFDIQGDLLVKEKIPVKG